ncbi:hypothetical protein AKJ16_DCAP22334 [Drosera capensis]
MAAARCRGNFPSFAEWGLFGIRFRAFGGRQDGQRREFRESGFQFWGSEFWATCLQETHQVNRWEVA